MQRKVPTGNMVQVIDNNRQLETVGKLVYNEILEKDYNQDEKSAYHMNEMLYITS